jgi:hypothetical protein
MFGDNNGYRGGCGHCFDECYVGLVADSTKVVTK